MIKRILMLLLVLCIASAVYAASKDKTPETVYVAVENAMLKEKPARFGSQIVSLNYGDVLTVIQADGDWYEVFDSYSGEYGWIPVGMVSKRRIIAGRQASATLDEIALAGKGFSQEVEDLYKNNSDIDFSLIDSVENVNISDDDLLKFLADGNLQEGR